MRFRILVNILFFSVCLATAGCSWVTEQVIDHRAGFPATELASDIKETSDEYEEEMHRERVEELSADYEEFLRSQEALDGNEEKEERSIVIIRERDHTD